MHDLRALVLLLTICALSACSRPPEPPPRTAADSTAEHETTVNTDGGDVVRANADIAGIETQYAAHFDGKQLSRIEATEQSATAGHETTSYEFHGARLVAYTSTTTAAPLRLKFDVTGAVIESSTPVDDSRVVQLRDRGQLLRSHALAQHARREHGH